MADRGVGVTDTAPGAGVAEVRTRERTINAATYAEQYVIPISERVPSYKGMVSTFRTIGRIATAQNLFSIFNTAGSTVLVAVRRVSIQMDTTTALTVVSPVMRTARMTADATNGTALTKVPVDTLLTSNASVTVKGDASADGTNSGTTLTSTPAAAKGWGQFVMRLHTAAGQVIMDDEAMIPQLSDDDPVILRAGEGLLVHVVAAATTSNPASNHYIVNCMWEEFTLP